MVLSKNTATITVNLNGEITDTLYTGDFKVKIFLSHADDLAKDRLRKDLLGDRPQDSSPLALGQAEMLSELQVRIVEAPDFWKQSRGGMDIYDANIINFLYEECLKVQQKAIDDRKSAATKAQEELKKNLTNPS